jgi:P-type conjugative transfer protein TrbG
VLRTILSTVLGVAAVAQTPNPPSEVKRQSEPTMVEQYDFASQVRALQGVAPVHSAVMDTSLDVSIIAPKDFVPRKDVPLTPTALEAVRVSERWLEETNAPAAGPDGKVVYSYGAGLPTIVCAPLRVCMIELQAGERIVGEPHIGDSVRWNISPANYGAGEEATSVIILKPQQPGLDTNLLITTDRRAYYVRLISKAQEYVARAAFAYPADDVRKWQQHLATQQARERATRRSVELTPAMIAVERMNFDYAIRGGDENLRPLRVFDDGAKTYVQMRPEIQHREAPALVVVGADGKGEMVNYRVQNQTYIVDRLFEKAQLILGSGKKAQKVEISRARKG